MHLYMPRPKDMQSTAQWSPGDWDSAINIGAATTALMAWIWRNTLKGALKWSCNWFKQPARIEELHQLLMKLSRRIDDLENEISAVIGMSRSVWNMSSDPIWQSDPMGLCVFANRAYLNLIGYQESEIFGHQWKQLIHYEDRERVFDEWEDCIRERRSFDLPYRWQAKSGQVIHIHAHADPVTNINGDVVCWVSMVSVVKPKRP